jgi:hypothetical protein
VVQYLPSIFNALGVIPSTEKKKKEYVRHTPAILAFKRLRQGRHLWLTPVILAPPEAEIRKIAGGFELFAWANISRDPISKNSSQKIGLLEWLKV